MTNLTDDQLVERIRRGDPAAFDALHARYHRVLARYAARLLRNAHDAEDAVLDAFIRALRHVRDEEREIELRPWLFTVVRNCCLDMLRARRDGPVSLDGLAAAEPSGGLDPHGTAVQRDGVRAVVADIGRLPDRQRRALVLSALEGRTHREIAERLGTSPEGSKSLVLRARARLASLRHALSAPLLKLGGGTAPVVALSAAAIVAPAG